MNWMKKNYDQFALGAFALALLACSGGVILNTLGFQNEFAATQTEPPHNDKIPALELTPVGEAREQLKKPVQWVLKEKTGSLFVSDQYTIDPSTKVPIPVKDGMIHPPVPNSWLLKYDLALFSTNVLQEDPDKDGFSTLDEYLGPDRSADNKSADATNPRDGKSHPPYYTKLFLKRYIRMPFRLLFNAYDGDPKKDKPEDMSFQINTLDLRQPTEFLKIGEMVRNTKFKLEKFVFKARLNPSTNVDDDVSELTVLNTETNENVVLEITKVTDSPDSFAQFTYLHPQPAQDIRVKKLQEFVLRPEIQEKYKLIDIMETEALIALPSGEKYKVPSQQK